MISISHFANADIFISFFRVNKYIHRGNQSKGGKYRLMVLVRVS